MANKEDIVITIITSLIIAFIGSVIFYGVYKIDKGSCYEQAELYKTEVIKYSYFKKYCFVEMSGKRVNLDKYRVIGE